MLDILQKKMHSDTEPEMKLKYYVSAARLQLGLLCYSIKNLG